MQSDHRTGRTLHVTNIPQDMDLQLLKSDMESYGTVMHWAAPPGPIHVYVVYATREMAISAMVGLREHRRLVVNHACVVSS